MKKYNIEVVAFMMTLFFSCVNNESSNNDVDLKEESNLVRKDTFRNAADEIEKVESYLDNKLSSVSFYSNNRLRKVLKYIEFKGKVIPNELFIFNANGDTLKDQSLYRVIYFKNDTISVDEEYKFKIVLEGHLFDSAYLALSPNVNEDFPVDAGKFNVLEMKNFQGPALAIRGNRKGWNYLKGRIDNVRNPRQEKGQPKTTIASIYFVDSFYVK